MYLNCKTYFSFKYGTFETGELVKAAAEKNVSAIALTNINNTCDAWYFVKKCREQQIKPVLGAEIRNGNNFLYLLLARNNEGFLHINHFLSEHLQQKIDFPVAPVLNKNVFVIYPLEKNVHDLQEQEFIGVQPTEVNKLFMQPVQQYAGKYVIRQPVTVQDRKRYELHKLLRAMDCNLLETQVTKQDMAAQHEFFVSPARLFEKFSRYPFIAANTMRLLESCSVDMEFGKDKTRKIYTASMEDDRRLLEKLALDGLKKRYGIKNKEAVSRVASELKVIDTMEFNAYYLITWDLIRQAKSRGFFHVGRGSGANSIVAYCLEITEVDPIALNLYFERFLNQFRSSPPDFDIDFSWKDRDEMIDYVFRRYGAQHVSLLGSFSTFRYDAATRELGKVFGLPKAEIDRLQWLREPEDNVHEKILRNAALIQGFPHHMSIHAGGMLISELPVHQYTATEMPPKGFATSQIDMHTAEDIGLFKLDILSQRGLGHIKEAVELVLKNKQLTINIQDVESFQKDPRINENLRIGNSIGCFYIESPAMRQLLYKLDCHDYATLVAASSIIRPGVSQSGMMEQYIFRHHNPDKFTYIHTAMEEILSETHGIMIYQEDVIKVGHEFGGLDKGQCDRLRKGMSGKSRGIDPFTELEPQFYTNCRAKGFSEQVILEVWRQMKSFAGYSFSKAHSASFAVESYQSLFLKTYYPMEFMVAVMNNNGGFYGKEVYYQELLQTGAIVLSPCINNSDILTNIKDTTVHLGLYMIDGLNSEFMEAITEERKRHGLYKNLVDFIERLHPDISQLNLLIRINAFRCTGKNKKELMWEANFLQKKNKGRVDMPMLFKEAPVKFFLPQLIQAPLDDALDEVELLHFPLRNPFELAADNPSQFITVDQFSAHIGKEVTVMGYLVTVKQSTTKHGDQMIFGTFYDHKIQWLDTIHWPGVLKNNPVSGRGFYALTGKLMVSYGKYNLEITSSRKLGILDRTDKINELFYKDRTYLEHVRLVA